MELYFKDHPQFKPNLTPKEMLQKGCFGGNYFRKIYSGVLKKQIENDYLQFSWAKQIDLCRYANPIYDKSINYYKVNCGTSLEFWESKGWIKAQDPRGWFQWYCRFYEGRRSEDDERQIKRWLKAAGPSGRFIKRSQTSVVCKQVLLHWAMDVEKKPHN